ncbi:hypothetical protein [Paracoccus onubensis]|uniref:Transposase n=1 Tax=Paracoccus onubensis TaxID=1675788 RepID=A0A418SUJ5_9RHOB|nr:hypothetical protein [Paracoccus onubensis]RJE84587.1 hypothetical protein D3P04_13140 [Paracoccus onubensis]
MGVTDGGRRGDLPYRSAIRLCAAKPHKGLRLQRFCSRIGRRFRADSPKMLIHNKLRVEKAMGNRLSDFLSKLQGKPAPVLTAILERLSDTPGDDFEAMKEIRQEWGQLGRQNKGFLPQLYGKRCICPLPQALRTGLRRCYAAPNTEDSMTDDNPPFRPFGFTVPISSTGRRIWPTGFKKFIIEKLDAGELTVQQVEQEGQVTRSLIYKWQAKSGADEAADRPRNPFAQVVSRMLQKETRPL